jgi:hypothetical protein
VVSPRVLGILREKVEDWSENLLDGLVLKEFPPESSAVWETAIPPFIPAIIEVKVIWEKDFGDSGRFAELLAGEEGLLGQDVVFFAEGGPVV